MNNANKIHRNLIPSNSQIEQATTMRKLAARLNALVAEMDAEDAERRSRGLDQPVRADLPLVVEIKQENTPTGRLRDDAYVPVRGIGNGSMRGLSGDHEVTILRTVLP